MKVEIQNLNSPGQRANDIPILNPSCDAHKPAVPDGCAGRLCRLAGAEAWVFFEFPQHDSRQESCLHLENSPVADFVSEDRMSDLVFHPAFKGCDH